MSYISYITSSWQRSFCPSDWQERINKAVSQASSTSSFDEDYLSFVELTKALVEQRSLVPFPNQRLLANERTNTLTYCNCNQKDAVFYSFPASNSQYLAPNFERGLGFSVEENYSKI